MRPGGQEGSTRELGIFHFLSKLWVQKALTGESVNRPERAGYGGVGEGHQALHGWGGRATGGPASWGVKAVFDRATLG